MSVGWQASGLPTLTWSGLEQASGSRTNCTNCSTRYGVHTYLKCTSDQHHRIVTSRSPESMPMCPATSATHCPGSASFHPLCLLPTSSTRPDSTLLLLKPRGHHSSHFPSSLPPSTDLRTYLTRLRPWRTISADVSLLFASSFGFRGPCCLAIR